MMINRLLVLLLAPVLLSACGTSYYYAEFIYPSRTYVPADLYKIGLVNHAAAPSSTAPIYNNGEVRDYAPGMPLRTAMKVADALEEENQAMGRYAITRIPWDNKSRPGDIRPGKEITLAQADSICLWDLVDGLILIEGADMSITTKGQVEMVTAMDENGNMMRVPEFTASSNISLTLRWRFYDYVRKAFIDEYEQTYEYTVDRVTYSEKEALAFNAREVSTVELASMAAVDYYSRVAPFWMEDFRLYYQTGNATMYRIATDLEYDGDWEKAASAWKALADDLDQKVAHRSRFNMAVASEMLGQPRMAKTWLQKAEEIKTSRDTQKYMERLDKQIMVYSVVSRQLGLDEE